MKSIRFLILLILASNLLFAQSGSVTSSMLPAEVNTSIGAQIEVNINIDMSAVNPPDQKLGSFTGVLSWDESMLSYQNDSGIKSGFLGNVVAGSNKLDFNGISSNGVDGNFAVLTVVFDVIGSGNSTLDLEYSAMAAALTFNSLLPILTVNDATVQIGTAPTADFAGNPLRGDAPLTVVFEDRSAGNINDWSWSFPGGSPASATGSGSKTVIYNHPGNYDVSLTVTGPGGSDTETKSSYIQVTDTQNDTVKSSVIPDADSAQMGEELVVSIQIDMSGVNAPNEKLGSFTGYLKWDPALLDYQSNSGISGGFMGNVVTTSDSIRFNGISSNGVTGKFTVLDVTFEAIALGQCILDLEYKVMASAATFADLMPFLIVVDDTVEVTEQMYTLDVTVMPSNTGSVSKNPDKPEYSENEMVQLTAIPTSQDYEFDHWEGHLNSDSNPCNILMDGNKSVTAHFRLATTVDSKDGKMPANFALNQNYPNPFNMETIISYNLSKSSVVELVIYNTHGQMIDVLDSGLKAAGNHQIVWSGRTINGLEVPSGVYVLKLYSSNSDILATRKLVLLK